MVLKEREVKRETPVAVKVPDVFEQGMKKKTKGYLFVGIGILVLALVTGFGFWLGSRGDGISSTEQKENEARIVSQIGQEQWEKVKETGPGLADKLLRDKTVAPVAPVNIPAGFKTGNWTETIQGKYGPLKVSYSISPELKDKIKSQLVAKDTDGRARIHLISPGSVGSTVFLTWKDKNGQVLVDDINRPLSPNEERDVMVDREGMTSVNVEVK